MQPFLVNLDSVDSTMREAKRRSAAGACGPLVVCARVQTGGVGRHGRPWSSPAGNLYWTILLDEAADRPRDAGLAFASALAVLDAVGHAGCRVKWPNDILLDGRKLAGLLVMADCGARVRVVVGIGINVGSAPADAAYPATCLAEAGLPVPSIAILRDRLTEAFLARRRQWHRDGLGSLRDAVAARLHGVGSVTTVALDRDRQHVITGVNEGLDAQGALVLRTKDGQRRTVVAGDVLGCAA